MARGQNTNDHPNRRVDRGRMMRDNDDAPPFGIPRPQLPEGPYDWGKEDVVAGPTPSEPQEITDSVDEEVIRKALKGF